MYAWFSDSLLKHLSVSVMLALGHWYSAAGLLCVALAVGRELPGT
jgi:hypothetical protein